MNMMEVSLMSPDQQNGVRAAEALGNGQNVFYNAV